ncbi:2-oxo-4-hydroxy-4-carboxy-5-ureidoimidazoline decarboxylase [Microlunatus capsulatus]|uniref:2-oxo-4-hydroxy-4-carboxy-5-ureidoimidazoline decarboxylase n=1 Tax=Microlunatus capsulatus TaxID=99117 RepID=A0ABS4Z912_9ACTN|nr:2-oxo-4-hydroxy-4-carboxy-5-ureidoimidazoline decarboxylase [Microlunatus capsulatus]MBP2417255.1 2-oxo-4-hydroxy-4-carboxy-5-ureidoimidazoline decarboxylase [Microlunatus capsulatus]
MTTPRVELTDAELREGLTACLAVPRWVDDVAARAPFGSLLELMDAAAAAATPLSAEEVDQALAHHPRIGEKARGEGTAQSFSRSEQSASQSEDEALAAALAEGNRAYEERFGRVFLIRAAGRDRATILAELQRRLTLDDATEAAVVASELRDIALLRIPQLFGHLDHHSGFDDPEAAQ